MYLRRRQTRRGCYGQICTTAQVSPRGVVPMLLATTDIIIIYHYYIICYMIFTFAVQIICVIIVKILSCSTQKNRSQIAWNMWSPWFSFFKLIDRSSLQPISLFKYCHPKLTGLKQTLIWVGISIPNSLVHNILVYLLYTYNSPALFKNFNISAMQNTSGRCRDRRPCQPSIWISSSGYPGWPHF